MITFSPSLETFMQIYNFVTSPVFVASVMHGCEIVTALVTTCSAASNFLPHPQEEEVNKVLLEISKLVNLIALNISKLQKK